MLHFFFNDTATTEIYTLSLHDALPIFRPSGTGSRTMAGRSRSGGTIVGVRAWQTSQDRVCRMSRDRKSTRLNSSHANISYAVFCLKKKHLHNKKKIIKKIIYELTKSST